MKGLKKGKKTLFLIFIFLPPLLRKVTTLLNLYRYLVLCGSACGIGSDLCGDGLPRRPTLKKGKPGSMVALARFGARLAAVMVLIAPSAALVTTPLSSRTLPRTLSLASTVYAPRFVCPPSSCLVAFMRDRGAGFSAYFVKTKVGLYR